MRSEPQRGSGRLTLATLKPNWTKSLTPGRFRVSTTTRRHRAAVLTSFHYDRGFHTASVAGVIDAVRPHPL
ncbi:MAG TPA: hypothetical protein VIV66_16365 [Pyrinomonadaceae bacterium]